MLTDQQIDQLAGHVAEHDANAKLLRAIVESANEGRATILHLQNTNDRLFKENFRLIEGNKALAATNIELGKIQAELRAALSRKVARRGDTAADHTVDAAAFAAERSKATEQAWLNVPWGQKNHQNFSVGDPAAAEAPVQGCGDQRLAEGDTQAARRADRLKRFVRRAQSPDGNTLTDAGLRELANDIEAFMVEKG